MITGFERGVVTCVHDACKFQEIFKNVSYV